MTKAKSTSARTATPESIAQKNPPVSAEERCRMIAEAVYFLAEKRGFLGGNVAEDRLQAEAEIDRMLREQGRLPAMTTEEIEQRVQGVLATDPTAIAAQVRAITLDALTRGRLDAEALKRVTASVVKGAREGVAHFGEHGNQALKDAIRGLDEALAGASEATRLAIQEAAGRTKDFSRQGLKRAADDLATREHAGVRPVRDARRSSRRGAGLAAVWPRFPRHRRDRVGAVRPVVGALSAHLRDHGLSMRRRYELRITTKARLFHSWIATLAFVTAGSVWPWPTLAAEETEVGTLSLVFENDVFSGSDGHYTSGLRASWLSAPDRTPAWALRAARWFPLFPEDGTVRTGYAIGQNMYTPEDIELKDPPLDDRPYAGWLYGSIGLIAETGRRLDQLGLTLGIVGPASLAEQTQEFIHEVTDSSEPRGWDTQLKNEPGVVLIYQRSWREFVSESVSGFGFDITPHAGGALGNVFTYVNAGLMLRFGQRLPLDYGPPRIQPSLPGSGFFAPQDGFGWYLFAGVEGRAVARNIFLDGNTFRDSRSVDKEPLVGDLQFGIALTWSDVRLGYTHVLRTREFETQGEADSFGGFSLSMRF